MPTMVQFAHGRLPMPSSLGSVYMMYRSVMKPGASMVAHAHFPGMLKRESMDVLPWGYHFTSHWTAVNCDKRLRSAKGCGRVRERQTYKREELPKVQHKLPVLTRWRQPVLNKRHVWVQRKLRALPELLGCPGAVAPLLPLCCPDPVMP